MKFISLKLAAVLAAVMVLSACQSMNGGSAGHTYSMPGGDDIIGQSRHVKVKYGDTIASIGQRYDVGVQEMKDANPHIKNPLHLEVGDALNIPSQYILPPPKYRKGIVINVAELRLYYFSPDGKSVSTYPVALGRESWRTPTGNTTIIRKKMNPSWRVPESIRKHVLAVKGERLPKVVPPGEDNPLGKYALYLGMNGYLIHGTNAPESIGYLVSSGCIRMFNKDVAELYHKVPKGTPVAIIHYPNKAGWRNNKLYLEVHKPITEKSGSYASQTIPAEEAIRQVSQGRNVNLDKQTINNALKKHSGDPTAIGNS